MVTMKGGEYMNCIDNQNLRKNKNDNGDEGGIPAPEQRLNDITSEKAKREFADALRQLVDDQEIGPTL